MVGFSVRERWHEHIEHRQSKHQDYDPKQQPHQHHLDQDQLQQQEQGGEGTHSHSHSHSHSSTHTSTHTSTSNHTEHVHKHEHDYEHEQEHEHKQHTHSHTHVHGHGHDSHSPIKVHFIGDHFQGKTNLISTIKKKQVSSLKFDVEPEDANLLVIFINLDECENGDHLDKVTTQFYDSLQGNVSSVCGIVLGVTSISDSGNDQKYWIDKKSADSQARYLQVKLPLSEEQLSCIMNAFTATHRFLKEKVYMKIGGNAGIGSVDGQGKKHRSSRT